MNDPSLFLIVFFGYFLSFVFYFANFELQKPKLFLWGQKTLSLTLTAHFLFILALFSSGRFLTANASEYLVSFLILSASFLVEWRFRVKSLMLFSLPIGILVSLLAMLHSGRMPSAVSSGAWLWLHLGFILSGFAGLIIAVASALMYLLQSYQLKSKHLGNVFLKLPSLNTLDSVHFRSLAGGVVLFSLGILSGIFWAGNLGELPQVVRDPKVLLSFFTCFLYWLILAFRLSSLRRGQKIALSTVIVFVFLLVTLMSSHYIPSGATTGL